MISLTINGKIQDLEGPTSLNSYLKSLGINLKFIAVAHNGAVLRREEFPSITLQQGDQLEIVRPVGGG